MLKESEVQLRAMGETLLADIVGLVRETLVLKKKEEGITDLPFPQDVKKRKAFRRIGGKEEARVDKAIGL